MTQEFFNKVDQVDDITIRQRRKINNEQNFLYCNTMMHFGLSLGEHLAALISLPKLQLM